MCDPHSTVARALSEPLSLSLMKGLRAAYGAYRPRLAASLMSPSPSLRLRIPTHSACLRLQ